MPTMAATAKLYSVPIILFSIGLFFQLFVLPTSFPKSHYDVLGVPRFATSDEVTDAYQKLSSRLSSELPVTVEDLKIRYAYELLTKNPLWKRDYDLFDVDDQLHVFDEVKEKFSGGTVPKIELPLLDSSISDSIKELGFKTLNAEEFSSIVGDSKPLLIQVYSAGSHRCAEFTHNWNRIVSSLDGVANTGIVDLGDAELASYLAEKKFSNLPFFRNGLPALVAFPPNCRSSDCVVRYQGILSVDAVVDWVTTSILGYPRILYYSKEALVPNFITKNGHHKVKVIFFSQTGERAAPFLRQASKDYLNYASFAFVLWREEEASIWWNMLHVESAPAIMFLKDKPVIHYGNVNSSQFVNLMEENKHHELPQLRSVTSMELGCDARGYSRAGSDTRAWYCVILVGRASPELSTMRETMRRARSIMTESITSNNVDTEFSVPIAASTTLKESRLSFVWLDGEAQKDYCFFYLQSENSYEACGPRNAPIDVPKLVIVRYERKTIEKAEKKIKTIWDTMQETDDNLASQIVAKYNGSENVQEIIQWISRVVEDGETKEVPYYIGKAPELVPEDSTPIWAKGAQGALSSGSGVASKVRSFVTDKSDCLRDPRVGPILMLAACLAFGTIFLQQNRTNLTAENVSEGTTGSERPRRKKSGHVAPPSMTDAVPKDAYQGLSTDSDAE